MDAMINFLALFNVVAGVLLVVLSMARMDRSYTIKVRAEEERKSLLRGDHHHRDHRRHQQRQPQ